MCFYLAIAPFAGWIEKKAVKVYNIKMQKIIEETRAKLYSHIGVNQQMPFSLPEPEDSAQAPVELYHAGRFVRKIPAENYAKLDKLVPISWI